LQWSICDAIFAILIQKREFKKTLALRFIDGFEKKKKLGFTASERKLFLREK